MIFRDKQTELHHNIYIIVILFCLYTLVQEKDGMGQFLHSYSYILKMQLQRKVTWLQYCNNVKMWQRDIWPEWDIRKSVEQRNDGGGDILTARVTLWQCDIMCDTGTEDQLAVSVTCPLPFPVYLAGRHHHNRHHHYHHLEYISLIFMACSSSFPAPLWSDIKVLNKNPINKSEIHLLHKSLKR